MNTIVRESLLNAVVFAVVIGFVSTTKANDDTLVLFNRDIRPILSDNCFACHGPDENQRQSDLRLDDRDGAIADLGGYAAIVPGDSDESELIRRIFSEDNDEIMPPATHRKKLTAEQKELVRRWIEQGAKWQQHWAWIPPSKTDLPTVESGNRSRNYIDRHILARLTAANLPPSPEADRTTLVRRLYSDLIGLPPTPDQVDAFLADSDTDAYENLVDQLLASPHFGERLAIYWLDLVRYADTVGYHGDQDISVSPYRDYVINAFNANLPFDQFTREQLAGDLLDSPTDNQLIASGYNRLGMMSAEGGVQPEEYLTKYAADRVRTTASVWLGATLGCAECHDHKFDPFSAKDFYSFAAYFADIKERGLYAGANNDGNWGPMKDVPDEELPTLLLPVDRQLDSLKESITAPPEVLADEQLEWETKIREQSFRWNHLNPLKVATAHKTENRILDDSSVLMTGKRTDQDCYVITVELPSGTHRGLRLEALAHDSLPNKGPGRANNGNFVLTQLLVLRADLPDRVEDLNQAFNLWDQDLREKNVGLSQATATIEQAADQNNPYKKWSAESAIDHDQHGPTFGWAILPENGKNNELVVNFAEPIEVKNPERFTIVLQQNHGNNGHLLGHFRFSTTPNADATADPFKTLPADVRQLVEKTPNERSAEQNHQVSEYYFSIAPRFEETRLAIAALQKQREETIKRHTRTSPITVAVAPREMRVLPRGNWMDKSGDVVQPRPPELLGGAAPTGDERQTRLDLANWIVDPNNPLTARVFANRLWKIYFGRGLSKVLDDVGSQGEWPTHPELLDALAIDFMQSGWDIKHLIRTIVTSQTYRQSSAPRDDLAIVDPYNKLLARQSRFRLDAELIRDNALAVSGLLVERIGGSSVKPYQPAGLYRHLNFPTRTYHADEDENQFRRGLYTHWQRQFLHPAMKAFDAPPREECTCERPRSNTPIGALVLLNDPSFVEAARKLAENTMRNNPGSDPATVVNQMIRRALSRTPNERETKVLIELYQSHLKHYQESTQEAQELIATGISKAPDDLPLEPMAAWTSVARTIMNLHEFVMRN